MRGQFGDRALGVEKHWQRHLRSPGLILALVAVLAGLPAGAAAQSMQSGQAAQTGQTVDAAYTNSRFFQEADRELQLRAYPLDHLPGGAREHAQAQISQARSAAAPGIGAAPVVGDHWVNIGPGPILGGQTPGSRPVSGRVSSVAVDPTNFNHWFAGAAQGGVWITLDAGVTWTTTTDAQPSLAMGSLTISPTNPSVVYAGTGEANFAGDSYGGAGLLKSSDGGSTWSVLGAPVFAGNGFSQLRIDPGNSNTLLAATARAGHSVNPPPPGIYRSLDAGLSWTRTLTGQATDLTVDPTNFGHQLAALGEIFGSGSNGLYRSMDGGQTWVTLPGPWSLAGRAGRMALAIAPSMPARAYVSVQDSLNTVGTGGQLLGLWQTDNAWDVTPIWTQITSAPGYCGTQCWYDHVVAVDPTNANIVYAGGIGAYRFDHVTWTQIDNVPPNGIHTDQHSLVFAGTTRLIAGNDGGVWSTTNAGAGWNDHNTTLATVQFYYGSVHPTDPNFAMGGSQDNGTEKWTGATSWNLVMGGDGAANAISSSAPNTNWAASFQQLNIRRTTDGGATFAIADGGINHTGAPFIGRFKKCPTNDDVFVAGTTTPWRTNNFFSSAPAQPTWSANGPAPGGGIIAIAFAPSDATCNTYAIGTSTGQMRLTSNGGSTWSDLVAGGSGALLPGRAITDLAFDTLDANILWVAYSGFDEATPGRPGHIFGGTRVLTAPIWLNLSPPANLPFNAIVVDPGNHSNLYAGSDIGVWKTTDAANTWSHMGPAVGMPNVAVVDLQLNDATNRLIAFTHGRSALALQMTAPVPTVTGVSPNQGPPAGGTSVTITGTNFTGTTAVNFGAVAATTFTLNSATSITATSPAHAAGSVDVTVTTPGGVSAVSGADQFTYVVQVIGGKGLKVSDGPAINQVQTDWSGGSAQDGYYIWRIDLSTSVSAFLPPAGLPANATTFTDTGPLHPADLDCYVVLALQTGAVIGQSDIECVLFGGRTATGAPATMGVQLNQSTITTLSWTPPSGAGQDGYVLYAFPLDGTAFRVSNLPGTATGTTDNTNGVGTCYVLLPTLGGGSLGSSDWECVFPNHATVGPVPAVRLSPQEVQQRTSEAIRAALTRRNAPANTGTH